MYTLPQEERNFNVHIFPGAPGFPTLTQGHIDFVKNSLLQIAARSILQMTFGLTLNGVHSSPKERQLQKSCVSFGDECSK